MISTFNILEELTALTKEVEAFHGYVQKTAAAIDVCRKRLNMFHPSQLKHEETR